MNTSPREPDLAPFFSPTSARRGIILIFSGLLLFFGQTFHYIVALGPLWALSKAFPILSLPAIIALRHYQRFPMTRQTLFTLTWLILVPSFAAGVYFHQNFFTSLSAQVKLLPILYFFSFLAVLLTLKPKLYELERSFMGLATIIAATMIGFWLFIPDSWYSGTYVVGEASFFSRDHRGNRIRMTMFFPLIALFFCFRRAYFEQSLRYFTAAALFVFVIAFIIKTRAMVIGITGVLALNVFIWSRHGTRVMMMLLLPILLTIVVAVWLLSDSLNTNVSTGFDTREMTILLATRFLGDDPMRWIFGVGTISPTSQGSLIDYFHHFFFLADITWLGIVFEYGLIGSLLILLLSLRGWWFYQNSIQPHVDDDFLGALRDYLLYALIISPFYPTMTLTPGEIATICAIFAYVWHVGEFDQPQNSRPLHV